MRKVIIFILLAFLLVLCAAPAYAQPALPHAFYGNVTVNGAPAADGTQVSATVDSGNIVATQNPVTTVDGSYGIGSPRLLVQGDIPNGATITFYVGSVEAEGQTATFEAGGGPTRRDLSITIAVPVAGGGAGPPDTTPPVISGISHCYEGVTETTADICWMTDEGSTSQVEYWASPSILSPLDESYVIEHHVRLTGLTPGTIYYYKTMSRDRAGNLAVSDVFTFTTLGKPPAAAFTSSDLSISPGEVDIGEIVTISVLVTNTGNLAGSYEVTLKIDDIVIASEEVTLAGGASQEVTFTTSKDIAGSYSVDINGLTGSFTVREKPAPPAPPPPEVPPVKPPIKWPLIGGIIGLVIAVGLLVFFLVRRRAY